MDKPDAGDPTLRLRHLQETLPQNLRDNVLPVGPDVEFVVLDYNSIPDLADWIFSNPELAPYLESGVLKYFRTEDPESFHMSHAKNMAHRLATGDVLCNLDSDNFLGQGFSRYLERVFTAYPDAIINPSVRVSKFFSPDERGFFGRLAIARKHFETLHGYDEHLHDPDSANWGGEDTDFMYRAKGMGLKHMRIDDLKFLGVILHDHRARVQNMVSAEYVDTEAKKIDDQRTRENLFDKFWRKSQVFARRIQINPNGDFGTGHVLDQHGQQFEIGPLETRAMSRFNVCAWGSRELFRGRLAPRIIPESFAHSDEDAPIVVAE